MSATATTTAPGIRGSLRRLPSWVTGALGALALVALWWISAVTVFANVGPGDAQAIPTPSRWSRDGRTTGGTCTRATSP
ncbi:hypothetical protein [Paraoerskovia sediminicola]|uniref:hypothetical protein n=1 Tax=Paraoerskovia sediminicola TaxID=1138587 RepID=UPI002573156E|nr:hypothetical protein [Paraoerskovia sediminicola]